MRKMNDKLLDRFNRIEKEHWWWEGRRELIKNLLQGRHPERILDIGCGTGETLTYLSTLFPKAKLYGIDTSSKAVSYAKRRGHPNIYKANAYRLPFRDNYFDVVLFLDVLEHIERDALAIGEAKRVLKSDGSIIITAPALSFIWSEHDVGQGHKRRYTRYEIRKLAFQNKLKVAFLGYFNFFLSPLIIAIRLLSRIRPFRWLADYDRSVNYDIANMGAVNHFLSAVFINEIKLLKYIRYPLGVSVSAELIKTK